MERLEIAVNDEVFVTEGFIEAMVAIEKIIQEWLQSSNEEPLNITIKKMGNKAPPALEINVVEVVKTKSAFG